TLDYIHERTRIDPWFLANIREIVEMEDRLRAYQGAEVRAKDEDATRALLLEAKQFGFADRQIGYLWGQAEAEVRRMPQDWGIVAVYKWVDPCAAELEAYTPYYYSTYESPIEVVSGQWSVVSEKGAPGQSASSPTTDYSPLTTTENEVRPPSGKDRIMILG